MTEKSKLLEDDDVCLFFICGYAMQSAGIKDFSIITKKTRTIREIINEIKETHPQIKEYNLMILYKKNKDELPIPLGQLSLLSDCIQSIAAVLVLTGY
jgi:hypothetical protein